MEAQAVSRERPLTTREKMTVKWAQWNPRRKLKLGDAYTEIKPSKPMDFNTEGAPAYHREKAIIVVGFVFWSIMYFVTEACIRQTFVMDIVLLTQLNTAANLIAGLAAIAAIYILVDAHKGTFQYYWKILQVIWRFLDGREAYPVELRVKDSQKLWPLTLDDRKIIESMELEIMEDYAEMYEDSFKKKTPEKGIVKKAKDAIDELIEVINK